jgi:hypothetical protein
MSNVVSDKDLRDFSAPKATGRPEPLVVTDPAESGVSLSDDREV